MNCIAWLGENNIHHAIRFFPEVIDELPDTLVGLFTEGAIQDLLPFKSVLRENLLVDELPKAHFHRRRGASKLLADRWNRPTLLRVAAKQDQDMQLLDGVDSSFDELLNSLEFLVFTHVAEGPSDCCSS